MGCAPRFELAAIDSGCRDGAAFPQVGVSFWAWPQLGGHPRAKAGRRIKKSAGAPPELQTTPSPSRTAWRVRWSAQGKRASRAGLGV